MTKRQENVTHKRARSSLSCLCFCHFPQYDVSGQVGYLGVSIPDLFLLYFQMFLKNQLFTFFRFKYTGKQIWPWREVDQDQLMINILINLVTPSYPMLHTCTKSQGFYHILGMVAILVMWPVSFIQTFFPPSNGDSTWKLALIGQEVSEKIFENGGQTPKHGNSLSSPCETDGSSEMAQLAKTLSTVMNFQLEELLKIAGSKI